MLYMPGCSPPFRKVPPPVTLVPYIPPESIKETTEFFKYTD